MMDNKILFAIGHITNDVSPFPHIGGGVSYSSVVAKKLGLEAHIITKCPKDHPYINELRKLGIIVHNLPKKDPFFKNKITSFENYYDEYGNRRQKVLELQEKIELNDLYEFPDIPRNSTILIAPVIDEVDHMLFPALARYNYLTVTPQGYFRFLEDETVKRAPWKNIDMLRYSGITILSDEDLTFNSAISDELFTRIKQACPIVVLTEGPKGLNVHDRNKNLEFHAKPLILGIDERKDFTGAGDSAASSFIRYYMETKDSIESSVFASLYAALKIKGIGGEGIGLATIPSEEQVWKFITENKERYYYFLRENGLSSLSFFPEGQTHFKERK